MIEGHVGPAVRSARIRAAIKLAETRLPVQMPQLRTAVGLGDPERPGAQIGLRWQPPIPGVGGAVQAQADSEARASKLAVSVAGVEYNRAARLAHLAVRRSRAYTEYLRQALRLAEATHDLEAEGVRLGSSTRVDLAATQFEWDRVQLNLFEASTRLSQAEGVLFQLTGAKADDRPCVVPGFRRRGEHPALRARQHALLAADAAAFGARRSGWLWPDFVEIKWDDVGQDGSRVFLQLGITLSPFESGALRAAERRLEGARVSLEDEGAAIEARYSTAQKVLQSAMERLKKTAAVHDRTLKSTRTLLGSAAGALGVDPRKLNGLRRSVLRVEWALSRAQFAVETARIELRAAAGQP